jgi:transcriptional regulator with XRE-family HTH domain
MSKKDWAAIVSEFKSSGLNQSEFARRNGLSGTTLSKYVCEERRGSGFVRIGGGASQQLEVELKNGTVVRLPLSSTEAQKILGQVND